MSALHEARLNAGLTQADVAERIGTKQSAIARIENSEPGSLTLRKYVDLAVACGLVPVDIELVPITVMKRALVEQLTDEKTPSISDGCAVGGAPSAVLDACARQSGPTPSPELDEYQPARGAASDDGMGPEPPIAPRPGVIRTT